MTEGQAVSFDYVNLNEVDPQGMKPENGKEFKFLVGGAEVKTYQNDKGSGEFINFRLVITDNENFSGRTYFKTLFPDKEGGKNATQRQLRIIMDATGVPQTGTIKEWLADLVSQRATFSTVLEDRPQKDGSSRQEPNLWKANPA